MIKPIHTLVHRYPPNEHGRDFAVGDIHGHFTRLQAALDAAGFDPMADRLFSVGDLVDRGPDSQDVDEWILRRPWFHAIRGNHEEMVIERSDIHFMNGGAWFYGLSHVEQDCYAAILADLPLVIEVETAAGIVGLVHADCPRREWSSMVQALENGGAEGDHVAAMCQWSRKRISDADASGVSGVRAVVVGHTPLKHPVVLGNVYHIDTAGWLPQEGGYFTLLNLNTLETIPPMPAKIDWEAA